ncbi:HD domain-containing protein [bacterium]|nr:HD domain-containing protein [bacterium]
MRILTTEELADLKVLPYNIYSEYGEKLFSAGEVLTPGKLLQLKSLNKIYRDDEEIFDAKSENLADIDYINKKATDDINIEDIETEESYINKENTLDSSKKNIDDTQDDEDNLLNNNDSIEDIFQKYTISSQKKEKVVEVFDMYQNQNNLRTNNTINNADLINYQGPINKTAKITPDNQIRIKASFYDAINNMRNRSIKETVDLFLNIRNTILQDIIYSHEDFTYSSQIKLIGEYQKCHALNVAILSGLVAKRMRMSESQVYDIVLAGLLHDIGKIRLDPDLINRHIQTLSKQEKKILQLHTNIGYKILSQEMKLPENIALIALEHHENNDGSGYPIQKSGNMISKESKIVHICNYFDNLSFNRTQYIIKSNKEAVKMMLKLGTKYFAPEALYVFVNMFSYNDTQNFEDMIL